MSAHPTSSSALASPCSQRLTCVAAVCSKLAAKPARMQDARNGMWVVRKTCMPKINDSRLDIAMLQEYVSGTSTDGETVRGDAQHRFVLGMTQPASTPLSQFFCVSLRHKERVRKVAASPACMEGLLAFGCIRRNSARWKARCGHVLYLR